MIHVLAIIAAVSLIFSTGFLAGACWCVVRRTNEAIDHVEAAHDHHA